FTVPQRKAATLKPTIHAIGTADAVFVLEWLPSFDRPFPCCCGARKVVRMDDIRGLPAFHLFESLAVIIKPPLIGEFEFTFRRHGINKAWNAIDRSEEHTSELQSPYDLVCRLLL